ncbi:sensor domain-containing diguanylate cyclase [Paenibacillus sp. MMS20-IR301]|uniref:sensor domain-containing diguanylate cyclase n=1 Tax=Paenibacillus sp. MMS20-IR301 TaxID=2895946 RepID=UPI0028E9EDD7|nr:sensor domain-containing diguanylate cyclase [Paenibacillus sp. MMS20-IR301]WNS45911.1 sensor domain-containing diguanylate cyclase [Paenibacillus sp. MMS20-IR301]
MPKSKGAEVRTKRKLSLTLLLMALVTMVFLLTTTILLVGSYQSKKKSLMATTLSLNYSNADRMSKTVDSLFRSMRSSLIYSAETISHMESPEPEVVDQYIDSIRNSSNYFNSVIRVDAAGQVLNNSPAALGMVGKRINSPAVLEALRLKTAYLSRPYTSSTTGRILFFMSEPLYNKDNYYLGQLGGTVYLQDYNILNMIFGNNTVDESGSYYYIVSPEGHLLFHPDKTRMNEDVSDNEVVQKLMQGQSGEMTAENTKGVLMLAGYSAVPSNGWGVVVVSPVKVIKDQLIAHLRKILSYTILPFIVMLLCAFVLAHRLAKPFVVLADMVNRIGKENADPPELKPHWNREVDLLTQAVVIAWADVQKQTDQLTQEARTDLLTGLTNRRALELSMNKWIAARVPFSVVVMDVDKFKFVNDTYGHLAGDEVLRRVAEVLTASIRPGDVCARYGGEEFVLLLPRTRAEDAYNVAERIRQTLEQSKISLPLQVTCSQGIAHYPTNGRTREELMGQADEALYTAKLSGRNRTVIAGE